ncbi:MAG: polysaccharide deacetylase family protein [Bacillota bacterium]|nr:polysaccharide deacetylase family protein [Bacillota bacterium]
MVCLTFDDGCGRKNVERILKVLRENEVHCSFFVMGKQLKAYPDLWRQAIQDGHEICYHSMRHSHMTKHSDEFLKRDIEQWFQTAKEVLGEDYNIPNIIRLPGGDGYKSKRVMKVITELNLRAVGWSQDTSSKGKSIAKIIRYMFRTPKPNSIVLIHFDPQNARALPLYIKVLKSRFTLGKVTEALAPLPTPTPTPEPTPTPAPTPDYSPTPGL